jgi:hypothetical protein
VIDVKTLCVMALLTQIQVYVQDVVCVQHQIVVYAMTATQTVSASQFYATVSNIQIQVFVTIKVIVLLQILACVVLSILGLDVLILLALERNKMIQLFVVDLAHVLLLTLVNAKQVM